MRMRLGSGASMSYPLKPGETVSHYVVRERLGSGGMGTVYRAEDTRLGREVALKFIHEAIGGDRHAVERFRREARAASSLNHPNVCTVYDVGEHEGRHFMVMELLDGQPLDRLVDGGPLPTKRLASLGIRVAEALAAAHEKGVVHRDLKPANVVVTGSGQPKVLDFGLAKLLPTSEGETLGRSVSSPDVIVGTLPYMAPEQLRGENVDARTDVHAVGELLYEMATGVRPYQEEIQPRLTDQILHSSPRSPSELNPKIEGRLEAIILKCLEKEPERRYQTMADLLADLRGWADNAEPPSKSRSHPLIGIAGAALAILAFAAAVLLISNLRGNPARNVIESLAVLPLANLSGDSEQEYFTDGMTEALIANLSKIGSLRVISRTSAMRYRDSDKSIPEIARELDVDAVVEGSVLRSGDRVRITAQLVEAATDRNLWAESYERDLEDVLALQSEVARAVAAEIRHTLTAEEGARFDNPGTVERDAYEAYLRGRYFFNRRNPEALKSAIDQFESATRLDPDYAPAWSGLADCYVLLSIVPFTELELAETLPKASEAASRAVALDDMLAEGHASLAYVRFWSWDFSAAHEGFRRAIELNPSYATAHFWYAASLAAVGRFDEAVAQAKEAQRLDPVSPILKAGVSWMYHHARRFEEEVTWANEALDLEPKFIIGAYRRAEGLLHGGHPNEAVSELERIAEALPDNPDLLAALGHAYAIAGRRDDAEGVLTDLEVLSTGRFVTAYDRVIVYAALGDTAEGLHWLEKAYDEQSWGLAHARVAVDLDPLRNDPRFETIVGRIDDSPSR